MRLTYNFNEHEFTYVVDHTEVVDEMVDFYCALYGVDPECGRKLIEGLDYDDLLNYRADTEFVEYLKKIKKSDAYAAFLESKEKWH